MALFTPAALKEGDLVGGYLLERRLGSGAAGMVYAGRNVRTGVFAAVKVLSPELLSSARATARFDREAKNLAKLQGNHVVRIYDVGATPQGLRYIAMELLDGRNLQEVLREKKQLPWDLAVDYVIQAAEGIEEAHANGIIHRDIKPANLVLVGPNRSQVKVLDFGISKTLDDDEVQVTRTNVTVGTPLYMSPEQLTRPRDLDGRSDIWSLGVVLYEFVAGRHPFTEYLGNVTRAIVDQEPLPLDKVVANVPHEIVGIVRRCMRKKPADRYASVGELIMELSRVFEQFRLDDSKTGDASHAVYPASESIDDATQVMDYQDLPSDNTMTEVRAPGSAMVAPSAPRSGSGFEELPTSVFDREPAIRSFSATADTLVPRDVTQRLPEDLSGPASEDEATQVRLPQEAGQVFPPTLASFTAPDDLPTLDRSVDAPPFSAPPVAARPIEIPVPRGFQGAGEASQKSKYYAPNTAEIDRIPVVYLVIAGIVGVVVGFTLIRLILR